MENIWKKINGYETYEINDTGIVRNVKTGRTLKQHKKAMRYFSIELQPKKQFFIHRLIAEHFIPNNENLPFVNHKNGNGFDNRIENLEWVTQKENLFHSKNITKNGTVVSMKKIKEIFNDFPNMSKEEFFLKLLENCK
jgi:hypothetical protein